jgi:hypothetical protein
MSLRKAINDKCRECIYCPITGNGSWRQQVAACTSKKCALYPVRPKPANDITKGLNAPENPELGHFGGFLDPREVVL